MHGHVYGAPTAPLVIEEFGDFECPYCQMVAPVLRTVVDDSDGEIRLVFHHFPLFEVHPHALTAALAAEAAAAQGKFWPMHDLLFEHQNDLGDANLRRLAEQLSIDPDTAVGDGAQRFGDVVERDYAEGIERGVDGTPALFVQGWRYRGQLTVKGIDEKLDHLREAAGRAPWARR